jgi:hypothetical protein
MANVIPTPEQLGDEVRRARLPDRRLKERLSKVVSSAARAPAASLPALCPSEAELEGAYRFLNNPRVKWRTVLAAHVVATAARARASPSEWLIAVHDTSTFHFGGTRAGLYQLEDGGNFDGHFSLCVDLERHPLGMLSVELFAPGEPAARRQTPDAERWWRNIVASERRLGRHTKHVVHVADREATSFGLMARMCQAGMGFVFRSCTGRLVELANLEDGTPVRIERCLEQSGGRLLREVHVSARRTRSPSSAKSFPSRDARMAELHVRAARVVLQRPGTAQRSLPDSLVLNLVEVFEPSPPAREEPIRWLLLTTESIDSLEDVARAVDAYRRRWLIEEYFKALKSGCAYETRQLESAHALFNALALLIPVAWRLLLLRSVAHAAPAQSASSLFSQDELALLRAVSRRVQLSSTPTVTDALFAIAGLGGHLKRNGPPGWMTLSRGYVALLNAGVGWLAARQAGEKPPTGF